MNPHDGIERYPNVDGTPAFTDRERTILGLMGLGRTATQIATVLRMSPHTVTDHKRRIFAKFGVRSQTHAVSRGIALGLFDPAGPSATASAPAPASLTVVYGAYSPCLDEVTATLRAHNLPFVLPPYAGRSTNDPWSPPDHTGTVTVLVDPDEAAWELSGRLRTPTVVVHSTTPDVTFTVNAVLNGAYAIVDYGNIRDDLCPVLALALIGYRTLTPANARLVAKRVAVLAAQPRPTGIPELTGRERDILLSIDRGHTVIQTARSLGVAVKTVENLQTRLFRKLGTRNRSETLVVAYRSGLLER